MPNDSSTHRLSLPPPQILTSSGTPSTSFYRKPISQLPSSIDFNLSPPYLLISFPTKYSNFIPLSSRILQILHFIFNHITLHLLSRSSRMFLEKNSLNSYLGHQHFLWSLSHSYIYFKQCLPILLPTITDLVKLSLTTGIFPKQLKLSSAIPLLKKYNLDKEDLSNYRPITHLSFVSKLTNEWSNNVSLIISRLITF